MGFENTGWIKVKPITLLFGHNSAGKSALIRALLLLRQSTGNHAEFGPLVFSSETGVDLGNYQNLVRGQIEKDKIVFEFRLEIDYEWAEQFRDWIPAADLAEWKKDASDREEQQLLRVESDALFNTQTEPSELEKPKLTADISLAFGMSSNRNIILEGVEIVSEHKIKLPHPKKSIHGRQSILSAQLNKKGRWTFASGLRLTYPIESKAGRKKEEDANISRDRFWKKVDVANRDGFFPTLEIDEGVGRRREDVYAVQRLLQEGFGTPISTFLRSITYLGPIRREPQRFYHVPQVAKSGVGVYGQHMVRAYIAASDEEKQRLDAINDWLKACKLDYHRNIVPLDTQEILYAILLEKSDAKTENIRDVGFGLSQSLPVMIESLLAPDDAIIIIEQPELHLHPAAQVALADFFIDQARIGGRRFILETHSEHFLLRFQRRIAETAYQQISPKEPPRNAGHELQAQALNIVFVTRVAGESKTEFIKVDRLGQLESPSDQFWGFFRYDYNDVDALDRTSADVVRFERSKNEIVSS
jgi:predicted ATPase